MIFRSRPDRPWGLPSLLYNGYRVFPGGRADGAWRWPSTSSSAEVKERVELFIYPPSRSSWPLLGWNLPLPLTFTWVAWHFADYAYRRGSPYSIPHYFMWHLLWSKWRWDRVSSPSATFRIQYMASVFSPQFVLLYRRWREMEILYNSESAFTDFYGCWLRVVLYRGLNLLQFSSVSIIPPLLLIHFNYHRHYINLVLDSVVK